MLCDKGSCKEHTPKLVKSELTVKESKESLERTKAELEAPDPTPERAKALLEEAERDDG